ncbi:MAG: transglutaminase-like domain-containing protein [Planctomycetia bacterium]|nr:transglutaminase-like domain-containing protein [Planctomycetia bacterium]
MKTTETITNEGVRTVATAELRIRRMGQTLTQRLGYETLCDVNGELIHGSYTLPGNVPMEIRVQSPDENGMGANVREKTVVDEVWNDGVKEREKKTDGKVNGIGEKSPENAGIGKNAGVGKRTGIEERTDGQERRDGRKPVAVITESVGHSRTVPFPPGTGGCATLQWSLRHPPMRSGEVRTFRSFEFGEDDLSETTLHAIGPENVDLPAPFVREEEMDFGKTPISVRMMRIERTTISSASPPQRWTLWCDEDGNIRKQTTELLGLTSYRVSESIVRKFADRVAGLDTLSSVPVHDATHGTFAGTDPQKIAQLRCTVTLRNTDEPLASFFPQTPCQRILSAEPGQVRFLLLTDTERQKWDEDDGNTISAENEWIPDVTPVTEDLAPNAWIESDAPEIVLVAESVAIGVDDPWKIAVTLESETRRRIPEPGYESGFESARTALRKGSGDCTEHAVLLAALLRARGIPSRIASGLILEPGQASFHAWTEVWLDGRWVGMDATRPMGGIAARYLKASADHLGGTGAIARIQRLLPVVGNLQITVTDVSYR